MKENDALPCFLTILPTICQIKIFVLTFIFSYFKKFHLSPLVDKQSFLMQTMAFQAKLSTNMFSKVTRYGYETFQMFIKRALQNVSPNVSLISNKAPKIASITNKGILLNERGWYKFMFCL